MIRNRDRRLWTPRYEPGLWLDLNPAAGVTTVDATVASPNDISTGSWTRSACTTPDADSILDNTSSGAHYISQAVSGFQSGKPAVITFDLKGDTRFRLDVTDLAVWNCVFDTVDGNTYKYLTPVGTVATIGAVDAGWYRCTLGLPSSSSPYYGFAISNGHANGSWVYTGDGAGKIHIRNISVVQQNVSAVLDQSGGGRTFLQTTAAQRPVRLDLLSGFMTRPCFDSTNLTAVCRMTSAPVTLAQPFTAYFPCIPSTGAAKRVCLTSADGSIELGLDATHHAYAYAGSTIASATDDRGTSVLTWVIDGANSQIYRGTTLEASGDAGSGSVSSQALTLGADAAGASPWGGQVARLLIYPGAHSPGQQARAARNLARMYGISL